MEIGHSRLLKFFKGDKPKMEKHTLKIENLAPSEIDSEVPRQQKLREATTEPVRIEPVENGTIEWIDLRDMIKKPVYMGLQEEVIRTPHRIRAPRVQEGPNEADKTPEDIKPQTRIPVSRFKPLAERVLRERRNAPDTNTLKSKREAPEKPRRTSIPKPTDKTPIIKKNPTGNVDDRQTVKIENEPVKEERGEAPAKTGERRAIRRDRIPVMRKDYYKIIKKDTTVNNSENGDENKDSSDDQMSVNNKINESDKTDAYEKLDDEFDKLYDEIVDTDAASLPDEILETKVKDTEKLESKFEEIVHQYDDDTIEQVKIEPVDKARYSRIPLLRRRSSHDVKVPRQVERKLSLKTVNINKSVEVRDENINESIIKKDSQQNGIREDSLGPELEDIEHENPQEDFVENVEMNDQMNEDRYIVESPHPMPDYNTIPTPDSELVKVGIFGISADIPLDDNRRNTHVATPELETVKVAVINIPAEDASIDINKDFETLETKPENINEVPEDTKLEDGSKEIEDSMTNENNSIKIKNNIEDPINNVNDKKDETKEIKYESIDYEPNHKNILIRNPDDDLKSFGLLKKANSIEERTKSRYINKPQNEKLDNNNVPTLEEDVLIAKGKVSSILRSLTSREHPSGYGTDNSLGKDEIDVKKNVENIPKNKSVLSKIAMFERVDPEPFPKKPIHKYSKPNRTISQEIKHSPKIVQEVLKPKGAEQPDNHTIVSVDIMKPVEVITNNEEQVMVVENLKKEAVIYDNFDDARLNKTEPVEIEPVKVITNNEEQVTVVENLKEKAVIYDNFDDARLNKIETLEYEPKELSITDQNETESTIYSALNDNYNKPEIRDVNQEAIKDLTTKEKPKFNYYHHETNDIDKNKNKFDNRDKAERWKSSEALADFVPVKEKINRLKSYEDINMKKAKSTAELDLGDAVKGKVKNMIVRMNSCDLLDDVKQREVINVKERPRKRSVSEKIAMFERKLTPVAMEDVKVDSGRALNVDSKPVADSMNSIQATEDVTAKIKELVNAKITYGKANMTYMQLRDGRRMPVLALGTALLDPRLAKHIVAAAIDLGFRAVDTAFIYGNEREVGEGIRAKLQDGTVRREELFITSKLWSTFHRPDLVETACRASLAATGLDYFDLLMIHNPMSLKEGPDPLPKIANVLQFSEYDYLDAWFAMEGLVLKGLVRSIGVSNFNSAQVARVLEKGRIKPVVNQVECHPYLSQQRLSEFCEARDVRLSCFGVLGSKGTPAELRASQAVAIDDPLVQVMAAGLGISPAQLLIRYQMASGHGVVVKASSAAHLRDDLRALGATLQPSQVAALQALNNNKRTFTFKGMGDTHRNYPFKIPF